MLSHKLNNSCNIKEMMCYVERNMVQNLVVCDSCIDTHILANNKVGMQKSYGLLLLRQRPSFVGN